MNHSSILQIHLNGGENSLSGGEHSIRIFSLASPSSSASSFPLLSKGPLIKKRNQGSSNRCAVWKAAAICKWAGKLSRIKSLIREVSRDLLLGVSWKSQDGVRCSRRSIIYWKHVTEQLQNRGWNESGSLTYIHTPIHLLPFDLRRNCWLENKTKDDLLYVFHPVFPNWKHHSWICYVRILYHPKCCC